MIQGEEGAFSALALLQAAIGIYGMLAYSVSRRTHEIGLRMVLGARSGDVIRLVLGQDAPVIALEIALGAVAALGMTRLLEGMLYEVKPADPVTHRGNGKRIPILPRPHARA